MIFLQCVAGTAQGQMPKSLNPTIFVELYTSSVSLWETGTILL